MKNVEREFEDIVKSVRFDDTPDETHRRQLEQRVLEVYDQRKKIAPAPSGVFYLKRVAIAAGFVIAAWLVYVAWDGDGTLPNGHPAHAPDPQRVEEILRREKASTATQRQALQAEIQQVWKLIAAEDVAALTAVVLDEEAAFSVRHWAGETVVKLGDDRTLGELEKHIELKNVTDPDDPAVLTAAGLRARLDASPLP